MITFRKSFYGGHNNLYPVISLFSAEETVIKVVQAHNQGKRIALKVFGEGLAHLVFVLVLLITSANQSFFA